ncbi:MAG TPA: choice-of-anchor tandem repeat GloVer-containing protein [Verrucomicrobiae bacterium]
MKTSANGRSARQTITAWLIQMFLAVAFAATALRAQPSVTFTNLHNFGVLSRGGNPVTDLAQGSDGNFYGTTEHGGSNFYGAVYQMSATGSTIIYSFTDGTDGANPLASLTQGSDGNFYGTASQGGNAGYGTVFKIAASGSLTPLYSFTNGTDGANPVAALVQGSDGNWYGTTSFGGANVYYGTVFKITASGSLTSLHSFTGGNDGGFPVAGLVQGSDGNFYGTAEYGGNDFGTVFKITPGGSLTPLYSFTGGNDGANPLAALVQGSDGNFYGTAAFNGANGLGTVFKISTGGSFTSLYSFVNGANGAYPEDALVQGSDGNFYGTTEYGGAVSNGAVFKITSGGSLTTLYSFTNGIDGSTPVAGLVQGSDGNFYGATEFGGTNKLGTLFKMSAGGSVTPLYSFTNGTDGLYPGATLLLGTDGNFYGTTEHGGDAPGIGDGTVFKMDPGGLFTPLYSFTGNDGSVPLGSLVQGSDGNIYGATFYGGSNGAGVIFKISSGGTFTHLYSFTGGKDGANPPGALVQGSSDNFYGTTETHGAGFGGTVFSITTGGSLTTLYSFTNNNDGEFPYAGLVPGSDGNFYGTTYAGGSNGYGTVFKITPGGSLTSLYSFTNGMDGANPEASLVQGNDGNFYGTASIGGTSGDGTVFKITPSGSLTSLYSFTNGIDGTFPTAALMQGTDGNFYSTTFEGGGPSIAGNIFQITPGGSLTPLFGFNEIDGAFPQAGLVQGPDGAFYGATSEYGIGGGGDIFRISAGLTTSATVSVITNNAAFGFANGVFGFDLAGPAGSNVVIEASTNLRTWIPLQTNLFGSGLLYFSDPQSPTNRLRFYRAVLP